MSGLFATGQIVDLIVLVMAVEAMLLCIRRALTGRGMEPLALLSALAPGICLLLALRLALTGAPWGAMAGCLTAAGILHACDLVYRHRIPTRSSVRGTPDPSRA